MKQVLTGEQIAALGTFSFAWMAPRGEESVEQFARAIESAVLAAQEQAPIDMVLHCPACRMQHIDAPDPNVTHWCKECNPEECEGCLSVPLERQRWTNPPHRSHKCHDPECGYIWRPADVPTNGVQAVKTKGKADSPIAAQGEAQPVSKQRELALLYADQCDSEAAEEKRLGNDSRAEHLACMAHVLRQLATPPAAPSAEARDAAEPYDEAVEALRSGINALPRCSFFINERGGVACVVDSSGRWIDWQSAHELFDPVAVDGLIAKERARAALAAHGGAVDGSAA